MKLSLDLVGKSSQEWINAVMNDFDAFLQDHANCERKASAMAMSFIAKYPNRVEIIPELIEIGIEELEHFQQVYQVMESRNVQLPSNMGQDIYVKNLIDNCRSDVENRFLDRLLVASIVECRGAERFRLVYENLDTGKLKTFYHNLWASEAKHGNVFVKMALLYFEKNKVYERLEWFNQIEADILAALPIQSALH